MAEQKTQPGVRLPQIAGNTDTSLLKIIALVFMIIDHVGVAFFPRVTELRILGRIAMPLYAWCLVVGSEYTHNGWKYALRLLVLGLISQPFYVMALTHSWTDLNILFLFFLGVLAIEGIKQKRWGSHIWAPALGIVLLQLLKVDYGLNGFLFILLLYAVRGSRGAIAAAFLAAAAFWGSVSFPVSSILGIKLSFMTGTVLAPVRQVFFQMQALMWLALPLILIRTRSGFRMPKWMGYGLYPIHLLALILVGLLLGVPLSHYLTSLGLL